MFKKIWVSLSTMAIATTSMWISIPIWAQVQPGGNSYQDLIQVLDCPDDLSSYGDYYDSGYWLGGDLCGKYGVAGYRVYSYPHWYIWANKIPPSASAYGDYGGLLQILYCPQDLPEYGYYHDYGYGDSRRWCNTFATEGYWVYSYPDWYIWSFSNK
ncbi:hypothetical protein [[Limnothrix rosea] IAM M-220]|uniref:hypothetical protein n=1 Tax=[Limnothrix rosea] IAM M-220 TaxID=454133 RepID=UPI00095ACB20|nr:hypothetical protein [[Limnothrix rosea] IAM M-220]OKH18729.1 hypothetical protein NIES208_04505 [[Limnothrix rosea] IAM M-220]